MAGYPIQSTRILKKIIIQYQGTTVSTYEFNYTESLYSKLIEVIKKGKYGTKLNSTVINYGNNNNNTPFNYSFTNPEDFNFQADITSTDLIPLDYDNDGKTDIALCEYHNQVIEGKTFKLYDKIQFFIPGDNALIYQYTLFPPGGSSFILNNQIEIPNIYGFSCGDYTEDKKDDFVIFEVSTVNQNSFTYLKLNKIMFYTDVSIPLHTDYVPGEFCYLNTGFIKFGDFDGNGKLDVLTYLSNGTDYIPQIYSPSTGEVTTLDNNDPFYSQLQDADFSQSIDFDGDGENEILYVYNGNLYVYKIENAVPQKLYQMSFPYKSDILVGDFNGDGKTDLFVKQRIDITPYQNYYILYSTGISFENVSNFEDYPNGWQGYFTDRFKVADFNGDGKIDILETGDIYCKIHYFNKYNNFIESSIPSSTSTLPDHYSDIRLIGDFNGDGNNDILYYDNNAIQYKITYCNPNNYQLLVSKIANGFGNETKITYQPITTSDNYINNTSTIKKLPIDVVTELKSTIPNNDFYTLRYKYYGGLYIDDKRMPFVGFHEIEATDLNTNNITRNYYTSYLGAYKGLLLYKTTSSNNYYNQSEEAISSTETQYQYYGYSSTPYSFFIYPHFTKEIDDLKNTEKDVISTYNSSTGNIDEQITQVGKHTGATLTDIDVQTDATYTYDAAGLTIPYELSRSDVSTTYPSEPSNANEQAFVQTETFQYDPTTGALTHHVKDDVTTDYEYYPLGALKSETVSSTGLQTILTRYEYDPTERFITKTINPALYESFATYNLARGLLLTQTDINNRTTSYKYNDFDGLIKTTYPDGTTSEKTLSWNEDNSLPDVKYFSYETATKKPYLKTYFDALGRVIKTETIDAFNRKVYTYTSYNNKVQIVENSEPYFENESPLKTTYTYLCDGRVLNINTDIATTQYDYNGLSTKSTNITTGQAVTKTTNAVNQIKSVTDDGGSISYSYNNMGLPQSINCNGNNTSIEYDDYGRQHYLHDPDAGTTEYQYNAYGELEYQVDNKGNLYDNMSYDVLGRLLTKTGPEGVYNYTYDSDPKNKGTLSLETAHGGISTSYTYDKLGRILKTSKNIDGKNFDFSYSYDNFGELTEEKYPSDFTIENMYNENGFLTQVNNKQNSQPVWVLEDINSKGQPTQLSLGNGLHTYRDYDSYNYLTSIKTGASKIYGLIQNYSYQFTPEWGRPTSRNNAFGDNEIFGYDEDHLKVNHLTSVNVINDPSKNFTMYYNNDGNISFKSDIGTYSYWGVQPHAVTSIDNSNQLVSEAPQNINYTPFNKVSEIIEDHDKLDFTYGTDQQRIKTEFFNNNAIQKIKYFAGSYELEITTQGTRELNYISGPMGLAAIFVKDDAHTQGKLYYIHSDHLGSITEITDDQGQLLQRMSYDAWGNRSLLADYTNTNNYLFDRGYTGHEHLDAFGLINMNGRLYDPLLGRMLSPDNYVQDATGTQGLNRYSYAMNNPMVYTDPDGEFIQYIIGAVIGGISGNMMADAYGYKGWDKFWYTLGGAAIGAATAGIGTAVSSSAGVVAGGVVGGAAGGAGFGTMGGYAAGLRGGDLFNAGFNGMWQGAVTGLAGSFVGGAIGGGWGALVGGATAGGLGTWMFGGSGEDILKGAALGGVMGFGVYHASLAYSYHVSGIKSTGLKYNQYARMMRLTQRSMFWNREGKFIPNSRGGVNFSKLGTRDATHKTVPDDYSDAIFDYHTHQEYGYEHFSTVQESMDAFGTQIYSDEFTRSQLNSSLYNFKEPMYLGTREGHILYMNSDYSRGLLTPYNFSSVFNPFNIAWSLSLIR